MAVKIRDLKIQYDERGKKKVNRVDNQDNLYLFYQDKREKIIIRDMFEQDAEPWVRAVMRTRKLTPEQMKLEQEKFKDEIHKRNEDDLEYRLMVTDVSGKILGKIDIAPLEGENKEAEAILQIGLRDQNTVNTKANAVIRAVRNLHQIYGWYDKILLRNAKGDLEELVS